MKRIIFILCFFIVALSIAANAATLKCTTRDGSIIITDNPQDGMKCEIYESNDEDTRKQVSKEYIERQKAVTDRIKARTEHERAETEQTRAYTSEYSKPKYRDEACEHNCGVDQNSCISDCTRLGKRHYNEVGCRSVCAENYRNCLERCDR